MKTPRPTLSVATSPNAHGADIARCNIGLQEAGFNVLDTSPIFDRRLREDMIEASLGLVAVPGRIENLDPQSAVSGLRGSVRTALGLGLPVYVTCELLEKQWELLAGEHEPSGEDLPPYTVIADDFSVIQRPVSWPPELAEITGGAEALK